ncbi:50S ribosomal protein L37Ae [Candidatus Methanoperedenaceae archaeon GB50]|nr:50S ribosomal protein L37Ae [Candidatus Methanoperedenaceae archaeon GB37]CAD7769275.1 50S ribosomal protein L37Ae [Candidatus Methanoperedenaceae archaeon GB50]CAD7771391.1 50S ribosomal protein L37Ae [Candidatus Methanoperedenaceae archaeon GB37]CAD7771495.1 50S ribosomal protein L37Ae [Candidatus Methanoperedenaceae archaeon GB50]CAD7773242.1 MAG: 50S ribosomal protein L37Ae [Candidatus Methanoperedenaceae archaeon GB50]
MTQQKKKGKKTGTSGRYGARYGRKLRRITATIEARTKQKYKCPQCKHNTLQRTHTGIWKCTKCNHTTTGGTHTPTTPQAQITQRTITQTTTQKKK